jgi:hypothetical protein
VVVDNIVLILKVVVDVLEEDIVIKVLLVNIVQLVVIILIILDQLVINARVDIINHHMDKEDVLVALKVNINHILLEHLVMYVHVVELLK